MEPGTSVCVALSIRTVNRYAQNLSEPSVPQRASLSFVVAYRKRTARRCVKLAGRSQMSDGYQRRNLCCRKEVKRVSMGSTCIPFRGAILYLGNCDIPFCRYGL